MKRLFAFFLLLLGVGMVVSGIYYKEIFNYLGINTESKEEREFPESILCARKKKNLEAELTVEETSKMFFTEKGFLTRVEDAAKISPIDNSEESVQKLNRYYTSMDKVMSTFKDYTGLVEKHSMESNQINYRINIDLKKYKKKKAVEQIQQQVPEEQTTDAITTDEDGNATVDFVSITKDAELKFAYKETYQKVKEAREKEGFDCTTN